MNLCKYIFFSSKISSQSKKSELWLSLCRWTGKGHLWIVSGKCSKSYIRSRLIDNRHTQKFMSLHLRLMVMFCILYTSMKVTKRIFTGVMKSVQDSYCSQLAERQPNQVGLTPKLTFSIFILPLLTDSSRPSTFPFFHLSKPTVT